MRVRASEIAERLASQPEQVAAMLLPGGKRKGQFWVAADLSGQPGDSLKVYLSGPKAGRWQDYATGGEDRGDLLDLWAAVRGQPISEAMRDAADWCGIKPEPVRHPKRKYQQPKAEIPELNLPHSSFFNIRSLNRPEIIEGYKVRSQKKYIAFVYYDPDGKPFFIKYRNPDNKKDMLIERECRPGLYGWQMIPPDVRSVTIVEGELDAIAMAHFGIPALSVPNGGGGGGKQSHWIEEEYDNLNRFDTIYLAMDMDDSGRAAMAEIMERLGADRCRVVELPENDPNACLQSGMTREQMLACLKNAKCIDPDELRKPTDFILSVEDDFHGQPDHELGFGPPFVEISKKLRFRPGEVIIIAGPNGSGKSQYAGHQILEAISANYRACVASMEFKPHRYLYRMVRQATTQRQPSKPYIQHTLRWMDERLWLFDVTGTAKIDRMMDVFRYGRKRYDIRVFLIDNLAKCGIAEDDYNGQKNFVDSLTDFSKETDSTVFLVHHMRKDGEGKNGVKGTGAITDMVDTVITTWRNHDKERHMEACSVKGIDPDPEIEASPDGLLSCVKQRNGESEPSQRTWFHLDSFQFLSSSKSRPFLYCPEYYGKAFESDNREVA